MSFVHSAMKFLDGLKRRAKESYALSLMDASSGRIQVAASPTGSYYADPFVVADGDSTYLFFEEFDYRRSRGHIAAARIGRDLTLEAPRRVLDPGCHASFPFVFRSEDAFFMLPETSHSRSVDLYACDAMPGEWRFAVRLLEQVDCADSVLHHSQGVWYLITSQTDARTSPNRWLAIYTSPSLFRRTWTPHPINRDRLYADRLYGYGRNAGALVDFGGKLLRPMQASANYYGQSMRVMEILELSETRYEEGPFDSDHLYCRIAAECDTHHVSAAGGIVAWDTRTHAGTWGAPRRATFSK